MSSIHLPSSANLKTRLTTGAVTSSNCRMERSFALPWIMTLLQLGGPASDPEAAGDSLPHSSPDFCRDVSWRSLFSRPTI